MFAKSFRGSFRARPVGHVFVAVLALSTAATVASAAPAQQPPRPGPVGVGLERPADHSGHVLPRRHLQRAGRRPHRAGRQPQGLGLRGRPHGPRRDPAAAAGAGRRGLPGVPAAAGCALPGADGHELADLPRPRHHGRAVGQLDRLAHRHLAAARGPDVADPLLRWCPEPDARRPPPERQHRPTRVVLQHPQPRRRPRARAAVARRRLRHGGGAGQPAAHGLPGRAVHLLRRQERPRPLLLRRRPGRGPVVGERRLRRRRRQLPPAERRCDRLDHGHEGRLLQHLQRAVERLRVEDQRPPALLHQRRRARVRTCGGRPRRGRRRARADLHRRAQPERKAWRARPSWRSTAPRR